MNWKKSIYRVIAFLVLTFSAWAGPAADFKVAGALYDAGKFTEAISAYEKMEPKTAAVYFNLGNAFFRAGQLGRAVVNFERARQLAPNDPDILANLKFTEERLGVLEANQPPGQFSRLTQMITESRTIQQWTVDEIVGVWLVMVFIAGAIWRPRWKTGFVIVAVLAGCSLAGASAALLYRVVNDHSRPLAVVIATKAEARFAPLADATVHFPLGEGTKIAILEDRGQWLLVERADTQQGWVKSDAVERVAWPVLNR
jgi:tetratricopeptide (TPR) repeat protein